MADVSSQRALVVQNRKRHADRVLADLSIYEWGKRRLVAPLHRAIHESLSAYLTFVKTLLGLEKHQGRVAAALDRADISFLQRQSDKTTSGESSSSTGPHAREALNSSEQGSSPHCQGRLPIRVSGGKAELASGLAAAFPLSQHLLRASHSPQAFRKLTLAFRSRSTIVPVEKTSHILATIVERQEVESVQTQRC